MTSHDAYDYDGQPEVYDSGYDRQYRDGYSAGTDDALLTERGEAPNFSPGHYTDGPFWRGYEDAQVAYERSQYSGV